MTRTMRPLDGVISAIREAERIALVCHISPDGDTVGSALAVRLGLMQLGKDVALYCQDKIPEVLSFLPGAEGFRMPEEGEHADLLLCLDVSDEKRMGRCNVLLQMAACTAQVDHHGTNPGYAQVNLVDLEQKILHMSQSIVFLNDEDDHTFHRSGCVRFYNRDFLAYIKDDAVQLGYEPCELCLP